MKEIEILQKAIDKAKEHGFTMPNKGGHEIFIDTTETVFDGKRMGWSYMDVVFSRTFAQSFWGEKMKNVTWSFGDKLETRAIPEWQYHLQQMVLEEHPIKYLEAFL